LLQKRSALPRQRATKVLVRPPKKQIKKIKEEFMKENTKQRITTPFLNFEQMIKRICQDEGNKEATTLILLYFGSLLQ
jgi:hypothetical protein